VETQITGKRATKKTDSDQTDTEDDAAYGHSNSTDDSGQFLGGSYCKLPQPGLFVGTCRDGLTEAQVKHLEKRVAASAEAAVRASSRYKSKLESQVEGTKRKDEVTAVICFVLLKMSCS